MVSLSYLFLRIAYVVCCLCFASCMEATAEIDDVVEKAASSANATLLRDMIVRVGEFTLDMARGSVTRDSLPLDVTPQQFTILARLLATPNVIVSQAELIKLISGVEEATDKELQALTSHIRRLRIKLEDKEKTLISTQVNQGYIIKIPGEIPERTLVDFSKYQNLEAGPFVFDLLSRRVVWFGNDSTTQPIYLRPRAFWALFLMASQPNHTFYETQLMDDFTDINPFGVIDGARVLMSEIRKALGEEGEKLFPKKLRGGQGYRLIWSTEK